MALHLQAEILSSVWSTKISPAAAIYYIWWESNRSVFRHQNLSLEDIIAKVESDLRACFCSWRHIKKTDENRLICTQIVYSISCIDSPDLVFCLPFLVFASVSLLPRPADWLCLCVFFPRGMPR